MLGMLGTLPSWGIQKWSSSLDHLFWWKVNRTWESLEHLCRLDTPRYSRFACRSICSLCLDWRGNNYSFDLPQIITSSKSFSSREEPTPAPWLLHVCKFIIQFRKYYESFVNVTVHCKFLRLHFEPFDSNPATLSREERGTSYATWPNLT